MKKFLLIDGNSVICRAYYALPNLSFNGVNTGGTYCFVNILNRILKKFDPTHILVAFDVSSKYTFRRKIDSQYKANRIFVDNPDLVVQFQFIKELLNLLEIKYDSVYGFEADDVIATYVSQSQYDNYIITGDKDLFQLISDTTRIIFPKKGISNVEVIDIREFRRNYTIEPSQFVDVKSLIGDSGDNVKGIEGIGIVSAIKLLLEYQSVEKIIEVSDSIKGKIGSRIRANLDRIKMAKQLVSLRRDVPINYCVDHCCVKVDWKKALEFFRKLGFKSIIDRFKKQMIDQKVNREALEQGYEF